MICGRCPLSARMREAGIAAVSRAREHLEPGWSKFQMFEMNSRHLYGLEVGLSLDLFLGPASSFVRPGHVVAALSSLLDQAHNPLLTEIG